MFSIGDRVEWWSQSAGKRVQKRGEVVERVTRNWCPRSRIKGGLRNHESYIVKARTYEHGAARGKSRLYWPRVEHLRMDPNP